MARNMGNRKQDTQAAQRAGVDYGIDHVFLVKTDQFKIFQPNKGQLIERLARLIIEKQPAPNPPEGHNG